MPNGLDDSTIPVLDPQAQRRFALNLPLNGVPPVLPSLAKPQTQADARTSLNGLPPVSLNGQSSDPSGSRSIPSTALPPVTATNPSPEEQRVQNVKTKLDKIQNTPTFTENLWNKTKGSDTLLGKIGHVGAGILRGVDIAGEALAPGIASAIPGTSMNKRLNEQKTEHELGNAEKENQEASTAEKDRAEAFKALHPSTKDTKESWEPILSGDKSIAGFRNTSTGELVGPNSPNLTPEMKDIIASAQPKAETGSAAPLSAGEIADYNSGLKDRYQVLNPKADLPPYFTLKNGATSKDFDRVDKLMQQVEQAAGIKSNKDLARADRNEREGEKTVYARTKDGRLVSESRADANANGHRIVKSNVGSTEEAKARESHAQFDRLLSNAQDAVDNLPAWNNENDRRLAIQISHKLFETSLPLAHIGGDYIDSFLNSDDYRGMTPQGQELMQNMLVLYSDVLTLAKQETGSSRTFKEAMAREDAILPKPEKTSAMNTQALMKFGHRMRQDAAGIARPADMKALGGIIPNDAVSRLRDGQTGEIVGFKGSDGKQHFFDEEK